MRLYLFSILSIKLLYCMYDNVEKYEEVHLD